MFSDAAFNLDFRVALIVDGLESVILMVIIHASTYLFNMIRNIISVENTIQ